MFSCFLAGEDPGWVYLAFLGLVVSLALMAWWWKRLERSGKVNRGHSIDRAGTAMLEVEKLFQPAKHHIIEAREENKSEDFNRESK